MDDVRGGATEGLDATMDNAEEQHRQQISQVSRSVRHHFDDMNQRLQRMKQIDVSLGQDVANTFQGAQAFQDMANPNAAVASGSSQSPVTVAKVTNPPKAKKKKRKQKQKRRRHWKQ